VRDVHQAEDAEQHRRPADHLASGRAVAVRMPQRAPGSDEQQQRHRPADQADAAVHHRADRVAGRAGKLPPDGRGDHDGQPDKGQAAAVATVRGVEVARTVADTPDDPADHMRDAEPDPDQPAADTEHEGRERTGARRGGRPGRARAGPGSGVATASLALPTSLGA
jgi:hypothetical protein